MYILKKRTLEAILSRYCVLKKRTLEAICNRQEEQGPFVPTFFNTLGGREVAALFHPLQEVVLAMFSVLVEHLTPLFLAK